MKFYSQWPICCNYLFLTAFLIDQKKLIKFWVISYNKNDICIYCPFDFLTHIFAVIPPKFECYHYTAVETLQIWTGGNEKKVCEQTPGRVFVEGKGVCGICWCCRGTCIYNYVVLLGIVIKFVVQTIKGKFLKFDW